MSKNNPYNKNRIISLIVMFILFVLVTTYWEFVGEYIKKFLESKFPQIILWCYVVSLSLVHRFSVGSEEHKDSFIYAHFGKYADTVFAISTYGIAGSTSLALLKGLFLQIFYGMSFFTGFSTFDLVTMVMLCSCLLVYCMLSTTTMLKEVIYQKETVDITPQK